MDSLAPLSELRTELSQAAGRLSRETAVLFLFASFGGSASLQQLERRAALPTTALLFPALVSTYWQHAVFGAIGVAALTGDLEAANLDDNSLGFALTDKGAAVVESEYHHRELIEFLWAL